MVPDLWAGEYETALDPLQTSRGRDWVGTPVCGTASSNAVVGIPCCNMKSIATDCTYTIPFQDRWDITCRCARYL